MKDKNCWDIKMHEDYEFMAVGDPIARHTFQFTEKSQRYAHGSHSRLARQSKRRHAVDMSKD
ncbi:hypothetical protein [Rhizobium sp. AAP43]|uniref:hypothetical protein n=1 Tax=Rhizobium sp. AAP43 TaxID=1523420 RepID=UPI0018D07DDA|nr:hypothetical protein [Rhizobium sp. AAP43]